MLYEYKMAKHIGIVAISSEGAALCYRSICQEASKVMGTFDHPEISMHTYPLSRYMDKIFRMDWDGVASLMVSSIKKLAALEVDFIICPDNTVHRSFNQVVKDSPLPLLSITEVVSHECYVKGYHKVGVLGTKYTMQGSIYQDVLSKYQIEMMVPDESDQERINTIILNELIYGKIKDSSLTGMITIIQKMKELGCDAVILGCTEIPLVINSENSPLPIIDSTRLLASKALEYSLSAREKA
jgi:aspartate racemase